MEIPFPHPGPALLLRIAVYGLLLAAAAWWLSRDVAANADWRGEWPKTNFSSRTVDLAEIRSLCNASIVFDRQIDAAALDFGTTGKLRKSDLVMYDRQTESWWQQFTGKGIVGRYAGTTLAQLPSTITSFADFRKAYPQGRVLSRETGYSRPYGRNPYRGYDRVGDTPFLFTDPVDLRLPAMERVLGIARDGKVRVYPFAALAAERIVNDRVGAEPVVVFTAEGMLSVLDAEVIKDSRRIPAAAAYSRVLGARSLSFELRGQRIYDRETGSEWDIFGRALGGPLKGERLKPVDGGVHFAFAWLAFHPDSDIYGKAQTPPANSSSGNRR